MKKILLAFSIMFAGFLHCYSIAEASTAESNASITFYEDDADNGVTNTGDENDKINNTEDESSAVDDTASSQDQGAVPKTGDTSSMKFILLGIGSLVILLLLIIGKKMSENKKITI